MATDTHLMCRTCLSLAGTCKSIFDIDENTKLKFSEMLTSCTGIPMNEDDSANYPKYICELCIVQLPSAWAFVTMCRSSEEKLQKFVAVGDATDIFNPTYEPLCKTEIKEEENPPSPNFSDMGADSDVIKEEPASDSQDEDNKALISFKVVRKAKRKGRRRGKYTKKKKDNEEYKCPSCSHISDTECRFKKHLKKLHPDLVDILINYPCLTCGKNFKRKSDLRVHTRIHSGEKPFACDYCPMRFAQSGTLIEHKRNHTGETPYSCEICAKVFSSRSSFWRHGRVHTKERPYSCELCGKSFSHSSTLKAHRLVHSDDRPHECNICGKAMKSKYAMQQHLVIHDEKHFVCEQCGKKFSLKSNLDGHKKKMHSEKAGRCELCGKDTSNLSEHMIIHSGEPHYQCHVCSRAFRQKSSLSFHIALHKNAEKYKCDVEGCQKAFPKPNMLDFHIRKMHSNETPHVCKHCNKGFFRNSDLTRHLNTLHPIVL